MRELAAAAVVKVGVVVEEDRGKEGPDMNAAVAALMGLGRTSAHSASLMPSGFLASEEGEVAVVFLPKVPNVV